MHLYQLKLVINENKVDEFVETLHSLLSRFRYEKGCQGCNLYRDIEKMKEYIVVAEWNTRQNMEQHFKGNEFSVLIGAARVLAEKFELSINETTDKGDVQLAKEKISAVTPTDIR